MSIIFVYRHDKLLVIIILYLCSMVLVREIRILFNYIGISMSGASKYYQSYLFGCN